MDNDWYSGVDICEQSSFIRQDDLLLAGLFLAKNMTFIDKIAP